YAAAARCFEEHLSRFNKEDVDVRLNLANCYVSLFDFDAAERNVHYILDRPNPPLSPYGFCVARGILGSAALGRGRNGEALNLFLQVLEQQGDEYDFLMALLAAAKLGDLDEFDEIYARAEKAAPDDVKRIQFYVDTLRAYALAAKGRRGEATALIQK